jgi:hypothetical protein
MDANEHKRLCLTILVGSIIEYEIVSLTDMLYLNNQCSVNIIQL